MLESCLKPIQELDAFVFKNLQETRLKTRSKPLCNLIGI